MTDTGVTTRTTRSTETLGTTGTMVARLGAGRREMNETHVAALTNGEDALRALQIRTNG